MIIPFAKNMYQIKSPNLYGWHFLIFRKPKNPITLQKSRERLSFILKLFGIFLGSLLVLIKCKYYLEVVLFLGFEVVIYSLRKNPNRKAINRFGLVFVFPANSGIPSLFLCLLYSYVTHKNRPCILLKP